MHNSRVIHFPTFDRSDVDWQTANRHIKANHGGLVIEMYGLPESMGQILLSDVVSGKMQSDAGVVLSVCPTVRDIEPGDHVLARPYYGHWFEGFRSGDYVAQHYVKAYGSLSTNEHYHQYENPAEVILAKITSEKQVRATGPWLFIRRHPLITHQGGLELPDSQKYRECKATIISCGSGFERKGEFVSCEYEPGDTILYNGRALVVNVLYADDFVDGDPQDYAFIKMQDVLCTLDKGVQSSRDAENRSERISQVECRREGETCEPPGQHCHCGKAGAGAT